jgi:phospholipid/cholesterol/gamma-HCH transport system substrate-binding protein
MKRGNEFLVGLSVIFAFALVIVGAVWLGEANLGGRDLIKTARFREIGGLNVGAPVTLRGVRVGRIDVIRLAEGGWVEADLRVKLEADLPPKPVAIAASQSLFGEWRVTVIDRTDAASDPTLIAQLDDAARPGGEVWPGATLPDFGQLTQQANRIATDVGTLTGRVSGALDSAAISDVRRSLRDLREAADRLAEFARRQTGPFNQTVSNLAATSVEVGAASKRVNDLLSRVDRATDSGQITEIVGAARSASTDLRAASADARALLATFREHQRTLVRVLETSDSVLAKVQSGRGSLGLLTRDSTLYLETTQVLAQMRQLLADIQANPRRYFRFSVF